MPKKKAREKEEKKKHIRKGSLASEKEVKKGDASPKKSEIHKKHEKEAQDAEKDKSVKVNPDSKGKKYFKIFSTFFISVFFIFISFQVWTHYNRVHFISLLPAESTVFATEINLKSMKNSYKFRQWVFTNIIDEEDIGTISKSDIGVFMNMDADLNIAKVDDFWLLGLRLRTGDRSSLIDVLNKHTKSVDEESNIVTLDVFGRDVFLTYVEDFMVFSYEKDKLRSFVDSIGGKQLISYKDINKLIPNISYFTPINLFYARLDFIVQGFMGEIKMNKDVSFENITEGHIDDTILVGGFLYDDIGVDLSIIRKNNLTISSNSKAEKPSISNEFIYKSCPNSNLASFSGYDFKDQWIDTQKRFFTFNYSLLQNLSYRFIDDIKEKTDFDIEGDMIFNAKDFYCIGIDENDGERNYSFVMEVEDLLDKEDFFKKLKVAFVRLAPFTKPVLNNYILKDGTKASEWVIKTDENIEEEQIKYGTDEITVVKFTNDEYPYDLNMASLDDLVVFGTDLNKLKNIIDFYRNEGSMVDEYIAKISLNPSKLFELFETMNIDNETQKKVRKIFEYISSAESVKKTQNAYEIRLNF